MKTYIALILLFMTLANASENMKIVKIALLIPHKKIGKYSTLVANTAFASLVVKNIPFEMKTYTIEHESHSEISNTLTRIKHDGFSHVIAPLTKDGESVIGAINPTIDIYIPTLNKYDASTKSKYIYYGGINYQEQSNLLLSHAKDKLIIFRDESSIAAELSNYQESQFRKLHKEDEANKATVMQYEIHSKNMSIELETKDNQLYKDATVILNTPIVKSAMIMSQLTLYDAVPSNILSLQINYNPFMLSLTQYRDRKNVIIANSITQKPQDILEANELFESDMLHDWICYTTAVGVDYFTHLQANAPRSFDIKVINNQMNYPIELIQPSLSKFSPYNP